MRVAIVHHWFVTRGGGERVAEVIGSMFPEADVFSLMADPAHLPLGLADRRIKSSVLERIPGARRFHRHLLPLYPFAVEQLDLTSYDLVLTSDSGPVKGVITNQNAVQICYCHSPMRYLWDGYHAYASQMPFLSRFVFSLSAHYVRNWDYQAAQRVTHFLANSAYVAGRIRHYYRRTSTILHPPIDTERGYIASGHDDYYLAAGRLVPYKRTDILIEACNRLGRRLRIIGEGPEMKRLRSMAGPTIEFAGRVNDKDLWDAYAHCRALLFAADEDFGMVPLEAQACGRPVIAFGKGGSLETVRGCSRRITRNRLEDLEPTGIFFYEQTADAVVDAILRLEDFAGGFCPKAIRNHALQFDTSVFIGRMRQFVGDALSSHSEQNWPPYSTPEESFPATEMQLAEETAGTCNVLTAV